MLNKTKCRLGANREALEKMTPSTSHIIPNKWTSQLQCWMTNESKLTVCKNRGRVFWRSSYSILWVYRSYAYHYLLALVALISRWIQNFGETVGLTFSAFHDWSSEQFKAFLCRLFSVSCKQDASDYEQNTPQYTYQRNETFFCREFDRFKAKSYISTA